MKRKLGIALMVLGLVLLATSVGLLLRNRKTAARAETASRELLTSVSQVISQNQATDPTEPPQTIPPTEPAPPEMKAVEVDGHLCVGFLTIPRLKLELPILARCTYENLQYFPCLYSGTTMENDMVLAAHNYSRHFGGIGQLVPGDEVVFVDMDGTTFSYQVAATDVVPPTAVEEVTAGRFDLALLTCTYGGKTRIVVYCDKA